MGYLGSHSLVELWVIIHWLVQPYAPWSYSMRHFRMLLRDPVHCRVENFLKWWRLQNENFHVTSMDLTPRCEGWSSEKTEVPFSYSGATGIMVSTCPLIQFAKIFQIHLCSIFFAARVAWCICHHRNTGRWVHAQWRWWWTTPQYVSVVKDLFTTLSLVIFEVMPMFRTNVNVAQWALLCLWATFHHLWYFWPENRRSFVSDVRHCASLTLTFGRCVKEVLRFRLPVLKKLMCFTFGCS